MQRFDFLVRLREVTEKEAQAYRDLLRPTKADELSPYQRVAVDSLRQLIQAERRAPCRRLEIAPRREQN